MEAVKLAPTLVPAAVLASKFESEAHQVRRSMRIVETAWLAQPHPDLADAYAHVKLGDSARQRLVRVETLAAKTPGHIEGALAIARAAIDASEFARAREALAPFIAIADPARGDADGGDRAHRAWRHRPRAGLDACARCARGTIRPGPRTAMSATAGGRCRRSPGGSTRSSGRRRWRRCRRTRAPRSKPRRSRKRCWRAPAPRQVEAAKRRSVEPPQGRTGRAGCGARTRTGGAGTCSRAGQRAAACGRRTCSAPVQLRHPAHAESAPAPAPLFRGRPICQDRAGAVPAVIPIVRAPDDPGIDDDGPGDEFAEQIGPPKAQAGGWRGFLSRWGELSRRPFDAFSSRESDRHSPKTLRSPRFLANPGRARYQVRTRFGPFADAPHGSPQ